MIYCNTIQFYSNRNCDVGFARNGETDLCEDIDECETIENLCDIDKQVCYNTRGSFRCLNIQNGEEVNHREECETGMRWNMKLDQCEGKYLKFNMIVYALLY